MKKIIPIIIIVMWSQFVTAQERLDNEIIVHGVTFQKAVNKLIEQGYGINKMDSNYKTVAVKMDVYQTMYIRFDTAGNMIITSDFFIPGNMFAQHTPVVYYKSSFNNARWRVVMKYAGLFDNLTYANVKSAGRNFE